MSATAYLLFACNCEKSWFILKYVFCLGGGGQNDSY